jgi:CBS domain-containing protein
MLKAKDIMTKNVITAKPGTTMEELARLLIENHISGVPVVDAQGKMRGVVTENDLISKNSKLHIPTVLRLFDAYIQLGKGKMESEIKKITATTVDEICSKDVVTVDEEASVEYIATIMTEKKIHTLPVLREGKLVGVIGKKDLIRSMSGK